ncbi:MAG: serine/threonine-protein kinase, partial [Terriglobales bacterium]
MSEADENGGPEPTPPSEADGETTPYGSEEPTAEQRWATSAPTSLRQRYDILRELGRGGMGVVYQARDRETDEMVALKVINPQIAADQAIVERFKNELRLARKITHKNVCRMYELLRFDDTVAIAMEYVEGESLRAILDRYGSVPLRRGMEWTGQICAALAEAHAQGIVHRDLKPENLLVDPYGQIKVMDFGIARSVDSRVTGTGVIIGTPAYMSPEQAEG